VRILDRSQLAGALWGSGCPVQVMDRMREALIAQSHGRGQTPMPMHLDLPRGEVHIKSSHRASGPFFALKVAGGFPGNVDLGLPVGDGLVVLFSAETGQPRVLFLDQGDLTDYRTAAVSAMVARELGRRDVCVGILGTGVQARLQARLHAAILPLREICLWGRSPSRIEDCRRDLHQHLPDVQITVCPTAAEVAARSRLLITTTASREPLLRLTDVAEGTLLSCVGSDTPGKQELDPAILDHADVILADSLSQCKKLGELQHAPRAAERAIEIGAYCEQRLTILPGAITVADYTGLGIEDLFVAEHCLAALGNDSSGL
jgi:ornithine cyclodeaminase